MTTEDSATNNPQTARLQDLTGVVLICHDPTQVLSAEEAADHVLVPIKPRENLLADGGGDFKVWKSRSEENGTLVWITTAEVTQRLSRKDAVQLTCWPQEILVVSVPTVEVIAQLGRFVAVVGEVVTSRTKYCTEK